VAGLFFLVSGESPTLPSSEVRSILEAEGFSYQILSALTQVLRFNADPSCIKPIAFRSAMTRVCGIEILNCKASPTEIFENIEMAEISSFMGESETFAVRMRRVKGSSPGIDGLALEREVGEIIRRNVSGSRVDLEAPQRTFFGILTDGRLLLGLKTASVKPGEFLERGPRRRMFFHSAAMPAKLARCMVNLAQPRTGDLVLDPFCGTGSFLVEAGLMGFRVIGFDVKRYMVEGSLRNLSLFGIETEGMALADARRPPLNEMSADCVVTDPPYGTSTTTLGVGTSDVLESFFRNISDVVKKESRVCLAAPKTIKVKEIGERSGFKHLESHFIYIHRSLTRDIAVFERE